MSGGGGALLSRRRVPEKCNCLQKMPCIFGVIVVRFAGFCGV